MSQTDTDFELIVIDDGSTDETARVVSEYDDSRVRYVVQKNQGVAGARNRGIQEAKGEWIAFLDSDDWWLPRKLEGVRSAIEKNPQVRIFHTKERWLRAGVELPQKEKHQNPTGYVYPQIVKICCISFSTIVIHRSVFETVGMFDEDFTVCEDYDFLLRAAYEFDVHLIPEVLTEKEGGRPDQLSSRFGLDGFRIQALLKMLKNGNLNDQDGDLTLETLLNLSKIYLKGVRKRGRQEEFEQYLEEIRIFKKDFKIE